MATLFSVFGCFFCWLQILIRVSGDDQGAPINFPPTIPIRIGCYDNWARELQVPDLWIATPESEADIVVLANWAYQNSFQLRPSGFMHNWSPLTVTNEYNGNVVLVETTVYLTNIQPPTLISPSKYSVTMQTGACMLEILTFLEKYRLGLYAVPAPGDLTIGGVLAIGGHGTGVPYVGEKIPAGHALGTISNLVVSYKAVVWDATTSQFVLETFQRTDVEAEPFLVNLGRTFLTEVTLMVGPNYNLRCVSSTSISKFDLFSVYPDDNGKTLSNILDETGRAEIILYPFQEYPWLKVWSITPTKPILSRQVTQPFNYPFSDNIPTEVAEIVGELVAGAWHLAPVLSTAFLAAQTAGLATTLSTDLWGPSKNLLLYVKATSLRYTANGYAVLSTRSNVQKILNTFDQFYESLIRSYQQDGKYPFNGPTEIRVTSLDKPGIVTNGEPPTFSAIHPFIDHPEYDTVVWFDILSVPGTPDLSQAMKDVETFILDEFDGTYASVRPEWSKGWAYTDAGAWTNDEFYENFIPSTFPNTTASDGWNWGVEVLDRYDPGRVFTNSFIDSLLQKRIR